MTPRLFHLHLTQLAAAVLFAVSENLYADRQIISDLRSVIATHPALNDNQRELYSRLVAEELEPFADLGPDKQSFAAENFRVYLEARGPIPATDAPRYDQYLEVAALQTRLALRWFAAESPISDVDRGLARHAESAAAAALPRFIGELAPELPARLRSDVGVSAAEGLHRHARQWANYFFPSTLHAVGAVDPDRLVEAFLADVSIPVQRSCLKQLPDWLPSGDLPEEERRKRYQSAVSSGASYVLSPVFSVSEQAVFETRGMAELARRPDIAELRQSVRRAAEALRRGGLPADDAITWREAMRWIIDDTGIRLESDGRIIIPSAWSAE